MPSVTPNRLHISVSTRAHNAVGNFYATRHNAVRNHARVVAALCVHWSPPPQHSGMEFALLLC
jgi:hypothetical protein